MKKKILTIVLSMLALLACAVALVACGNAESSDPGSMGNKDHVHEYVDYEYNKDATCVADGTETSKCKYCDKTDTRRSETYLATGVHSFVDYEYNKDATCVADGTETAKCDNCAETDTHVIPNSAAHNYDDYLCVFCDSVDPDAPATENLDFSEVIENDEIVGYCVSKMHSNYRYVKIPQTHLGKPVTGIKGGAFESCRSLRRVDIPNSVTSIGGSAFRDCNRLASIEMPNSVTSIGGNAFWACHSLTSIEIPSSVTSIGGYAFRGCISLSSIEIPSSVTSIGGSAFSGCSMVIYCEPVQNPWYDGSFSGATERINGKLYDTNIITIWDCKNTRKDKNGYSCEMIDGIRYLLKDGVAAVDSRQYNLYGDIIIPETVEYDGRKYIVTSINSGAFKYCSDLTSIEIPNSVTSIAGFSGCSGLTNVKIPDSVTRIGSEAFQNCSKLTSIEIPNSVTSIGKGAFGGTSYYKDERNWDNEALYIGRHLIEAKNTISGAYTIKQGTLTIANSAFYGCGSLTSIGIPNSVTSIDEWAFQGCSSLTSITIPNSVTTIGRGAFYGCSKLTSVTLGNSVTSIGDYAFKSCGNLTSIVVPNSITSIGSDAFDGCDSLTYNLYDKGYYLGNSNNEYAVFVKAVRDTITSCTIHPETRFICSKAFDHCDEFGFSSLTIPDKVVGIGSEAFGIRRLATISFGRSVADISSYIFKPFACPALTQVIVSKDNSKYHCINNCVIEKESKKLVLAVRSSIVPSDGSVAIIGSGAYYPCSSIVDVVIPDGVTSIESSAIAVSFVKTIVIPDSVTYIGPYAFACQYLEMIYCESEAKQPNWSCEWNKYLGKYYPVLWDYKNQKED